jgi:hypothetical protein
LDWRWRWWDCLSHWGVSAGSGAYQATSGSSAKTVRIYIPFASMIVISLVLSLIFYIARRFM